MAHSTIHFSVGLVAGTLITLPRILGALRAHKPLSWPIRRCLLTSYVLGAFAIMPAVLRHIGVPETICSHWWTNLFLLHPTIHRLKSGGVTMGPLLLGFLLACQYGMVVLAVWLAHGTTTRD